MGRQNGVCPFLRVFSPALQRFSQKSTVNSKNIPRKHSHNEKEVNNKRFLSNSVYFFIRQKQI